MLPSKTISLYAPPMLTKTMDKTFAKLRVAAKAAKLPEVEASTSHGKPALELHGKFMAGVKDVDVLVLMCPVEEKASPVARLAHARAQASDRQRGGKIALVSGVTGSRQD